MTPLGGITRNDISDSLSCTQGPPRARETRRDATRCAGPRGWLTVGGADGRVREKEGEIPHTRGTSSFLSRRDAEPTTPTRRSSHSRPIVLNREGTFLKPYRTACRNAATIGFRTAGGGPDIWLANENFNNSASPTSREFSFFPSFFVVFFFFFYHRPSPGPSQSRADKWWAIATVDYRRARARTSLDFNCREFRSNRDSMCFHTSSNGPPTLRKSSILEIRKQRGATRWQARLRSLADRNLISRCP